MTLTIATDQEIYNKHSIMSCYMIYDTTHLNKLPHDILDYIWSMNHLWATKILQNAVRSFIRTKITEVDSMLSFARHDCKLGAEMKNYSIFYRNKVLKSNDVLKTFASCKCCERHQINKPTVLAMWHDIEVTRYRQERFCLCPCRHLSRWICRGVE